MATSKATAGKTDLLNLKSDKPKVIGPKVENENAQKFVTGQGEVVIRFKNFTKEPKYFIYTVTEVDVDGKPLTEKPAEQQ